MKSTTYIKVCIILSTYSVFQIFYISFQILQSYVRIKVHSRLLHLPSKGNSVKFTVSMNARMRVASGYIETMRFLRPLTRHTH